MRTNGFKLLGIFLISAALACNSNTTKTVDTDSVALDGEKEVTYVNLTTGEPVKITKDAEKGYYIYSDTKMPVEQDMIFVDMTSQDTLYGQTGAIVNNAILKSTSGAWALNEALVERNGDDIKIKTADSKLKIDGDKMKYKDGDTKIKVDGDEVKIKTDDSKIKIDGSETKIKTKDTN